MKKTVSILMLAVLIIGSIMPLAANNAAVERIALNQTSYKPGDSIFVNGKLASPYGTVSYYLESPKGEKVFVGQETADADGSFQSATNTKLPSTMSSGEYSFYVNGTYHSGVSINTLSATLSLSQSTLKVDEVLDIEVFVTENGAPAPHAEVLFSLYENGEKVSAVEQRYTDTNGRVLIKHKTQFKGQYEVRVDIMGEQLTQTFTVTQKNTTPPPAGGGSTPPPVPAPIPTPGGGNTEVFELLTDEGVPLSGAEVEIKSNRSGDASIKVKLDAEIFKKSMASMKRIELKIPESNPKTIDLTIPSDILAAASEAGKDIYLVSDKLEVLISPEAFDLESGKSVTLSVNRIGNKGDVFEVKAFEDGTDAQVGLGKKLVLKFRFDASSVKNKKSLVVKKLNPDTGVYEFVGGKLDGLAPVIEVEVDDLGVYSVNEFENAFNDLKEAHWAYDEIGALVSREIFKGVDEAHFDDKRKITRSEFVATLVRALQLEEADGAVDLTDIDGKWYTDELKTAAQYGIIENEGAFKPVDVISREDMAVMLVKALGLKSDVSVEDAQKALEQFSDAGALSETSKAYVAKATEAGLIKGIDGSFVPSGEASRAEAAIVIFRLLDALGYM